MKKLRLSGYFRRFDVRMFILAAILAAFGLTTIYSIGIHSATPQIEKFQRQGVFLLIGVALCFLVSFIDYRFWRNAAWIMYIFGALLLGGVLIFGTTIRGTTGWINLGFTVFQPVEIAKITLAMILAAWYDHHSARLDQFRYILASTGFVALYVLLVLFQPDLGSAMVFVGMWIIMLLIIRTKWWYKALILGGCFLAIFASWFFLEDYQKNRIEIFLHPSADPLGQGYNVTQSIIAVGSGKLFGRGLGLGPQSQLNFLPEQETDFIFAVISEELGLLGAGIILLCFGLLFQRIWSQSRYVNDEFGMYLLLFGLVQLFIQVFVNIGMNIGIMPVTGIPLPFISSGGSSLVATWLFIGIFESVVLRQNTVKIT